MKLKSFVLFTMVWVGVGVSAVQAQTYKPLPDAVPGPGSAMIPTVSTPAVISPPEAGPAPALSSWITYCQNGCQFPLGGNGPIRYELYLQPGFSFPIGGNFFGHTLRDGWEIQGGGRTLFFNPEGDSAWTVDLGLGNIHNIGQHSDRSVTLRNIIVQTPSSFGSTGTVVPSIQVTTEALNRTFVSLGFGREHYFYGPPQGDDWTWRIGWDAGGRYGSEKLELHEIQHRTDTIAGLFAALHSDVEIPWGCITVFTGVRMEWAYTWSDILQHQNNSDVQDINLLFNVGLRF